MPETRTWSIRVLTAGSTVGRTDGWFEVQFRTGEQEEEKEEGGDGQDQSTETSALDRCPSESIDQIGTNGTADDHRRQSDSTGNERGNGGF